MEFINMEEGRAVFVDFFIGRIRADELIEVVRFKFMRLLGKGC
jgi:hypothetical protein